MHASKSVFFTPLKELRLRGYECEYFNTFGDTKNTKEKWYQAAANLMRVPGFILEMNNIHNSGKKAVVDQDAVGLIAQALRCSQKATLNYHMHGYESEEALKKLFNGIKEATALTADLSNNRLLEVTDATWKCILDAIRNCKEDLKLNLSYNSVQKPFFIESRLQQLVAAVRASKNISEMVIIDHPTAQHQICEILEKRNEAKKAAMQQPEHISRIQRRNSF